MSTARKGKKMIKVDVVRVERNKVVIRIFHEKTDPVSYSMEYSITNNDFMFEFKVFDKKLEVLSGDVRKDLCMNVKFAKGGYWHYCCTEHIDIQAELLKKIREIGLRELGERE